MGARRGHGAADELDAFFAPKRKKKAASASSSPRECAKAPAVTESPRANPTEASIPVGVRKVLAVVQKLLEDIACGPSDPIELWAKGSGAPLLMLLSKHSKCIDSLLRRPLWPEHLRSGHESVLKQAVFNIDGLSGGQLVVTITTRCAVVNEPSLAELAAGDKTVRQALRLLVLSYGFKYLEALTERSRNLEVVFCGKTYVLKHKDHFALGPGDAPWMEVHDMFAPPRVRPSSSSPTQCRQEPHRPLQLEEKQPAEARLASRIASRNAWKQRGKEQSQSVAAPELAPVSGAIAAASSSQSSVQRASAVAGNSAAAVAEDMDEVACLLEEEDMDVPELSSSSSSSSSSPATSRLSSKVSGKGIGKARLGRRSASGLRHATDSARCHWMISPESLLNRSDPNTRRFLERLYLGYAMLGNPSKVPSAGPARLPQASMVGRLWRGWLAYELKPRGWLSSIPEDGVKCLPSPFSWDWVSEPDRPHSQQP